MCNSATWADQASHPFAIASAIFFTNRSLWLSSKILVCSVPCSIRRVVLFLLLVRMLASLSDDRRSSSFRQVISVSVAAATFFAFSTMAVCVWRSSQSWLWSTTGSPTVPALWPFSLASCSCHFKVWIVALFSSNRCREDNASRCQNNVKFIERHFPSGACDEEHVGIFDSWISVQKPNIQPPERLMLPSRSRRTQMYLYKKGEKRRGRRRSEASGVLAEHKTNTKEKKKES